ncbi:protein of unknown function [Streptomyces sp. KY75]|nr:protein of unknown function [Streptomyces sp. KY70]CAD5992049.1 protein of unknown function [Streptomyces sp. KY75]
MGQDDEAAGGQCLAQFGDRRARIVGVLDEVEHRDEQQGHRAVQVEESGDRRVLQDLLGAAQVGGGDDGQVVALQHRLAVCDGDRVVVDVRHLGPRVGGLGHLVDVAEGRDAGADVEELIDPLADRVPHGPAHKGPIRLHDLGKAREELHGLPRGFPVHLEIVRSAQIEVVHAGHARHRDIYALRCPGGTLHRCLQQVRHGDPAMFMVSVDQRLLIDRQESEWKRKLGIRYWSHSGGNNGRSRRCAYTCSDGPALHSPIPGGSGPLGSYWAVTSWS